jgi:hypothetical protein
MPAPNRTAQSPPARRRERVKRPHEDERDRLAVAAMWPLDNIGAM